MTVRFSQTLYRIRPAANFARPKFISAEITKVLEDSEEYPHIIKHVEGHPQGPMTSTLFMTYDVYLFYERSHAYQVMQAVMRNLGLLEEWSPEDLQETPDDESTTGEDAELEIDAVETPEDEQWLVVPERIFIHAQEA